MAEQLQRFSQKQVGKPKGFEDDIETRVSRERTAAYARAGRKQPYREDTGEEKVKRRRAQGGCLGTESR